MKYCQGPNCHKYKTKDRIRGSKGDKHYETRKRSHFYYGNNTCCTLNCHNDWWSQFGTRAIDHFGRIHEPKRTDANGAGTRIIDGLVVAIINITFINDLLGQRISNYTTTISRRQLHISNKLN